MLLEGCKLRATGHTLFKGVSCLVMSCYLCVQVSAISVVFVIILVVLMPFSRCYSVMSHVCQLYASIIIIAKMMYQLHRVPEDLAKSNCTVSIYGTFRSQLFLIDSVAHLLLQ